MVTASAPASAANLGPGFDVLAIALDLRCEVEVIAAGAWSVTSDGRRVDEETASFVRSVAGDAPKDIYIRSAIPSARGLGSSAAVRVATAAATAVLESGAFDHDAVLEIAATAEGHPDNAAAAVHGGLTFVDATGGVHRLGVHPGIEVVVAVPSMELETSRSRAVLPDMVSRSVAVRTAARVAALVEGLRTGDPTVLAAAGGDELHEQPRADLAPLAADLMTAARAAGALHACWSGAGPSVLAFVTDSTGEAVRAAFEDVLAGDGEVLEPQIDRSGVLVES
jgi:homoserine kinase